jgi:carboxyl-terminal processing protease
MKSRAALWGGAVLIVAVIGFASGVYVDQAFPDYVPYVANHSVGRINTTELEQAIQVIEADYVDGNLDSNKLSHGTVQGLVASLGDPFTAYYDPAQFKRLQDSYKGQYSGIGIYLTFGTGYPVITGTVPGSPAAAAGLQSGDAIIKVGDKDMKGITSDQATTLIQGPTGSKVTITIARTGSTMTFTITRAEIHVPSVRSTLIGNNVRYLRIYSFGESTSNEFADALSKGLPGANAIVLDLRGNPGGFVSAADDVISQFVATGETFEWRGRIGPVEKHQVNGHPKAPTLPLAVLVDANSASASEIVAGSLQVHNRAKLVGTVTYGKGSVQQDFPLNNGADIHLTIKRWYLPNGVTIDHKGLQPDVPMTLLNASDQFDVTQLSAGYAKDTQLNAALKLIASG